MRRATTYLRPPIGALGALPELSLAGVSTEDRSEDDCCECIATWIAKANAALVERNLEGAARAAAVAAAAEAATTATADVEDEAGLLLGERVMARAMRQAGGVACVEGSYARHLFTSVFGFAVPSREAIAAVEAVCRIAGSSRAAVLEVGAGNGYWCRELARAGVAVVGSDSFEWERGRAVSPLLEFRHMWHDVARMGAAEAVAEQPEAVPLVVWPYPDTSFVHEALALTAAKYFIIVGEEGSEGYTEDPFCDGQNAEWELLQQVRIKTWPGVRDTMKIMRRRPT